MPFACTTFMWEITVPSTKFINNSDSAKIRFCLYTLCVGDYNACHKHHWLSTKYNTLVDHHQKYLSRELQRRVVQTCYFLFCFFCYAVFLIYSNFRQDV